MISKSYIRLIIILMATGFSCSPNYTPKPKGYPRIVLPDKSYGLYDSVVPFRFEYPKYAEVLPNRSQNAEPYWLNIEFPELNGTIYLSYKPIQNNLNLFIEDSRTFVYKHVMKADEIPETPINIPENKVYGIFYDIKGNAASAVQFFLTDSTRHFVRGSLYFNAQPDKDSLSPVIEFVREDIIHLINTFQWKSL
jgi:gliding motility-associated lipoprotein GldD